MQSETHFFGDGAYPLTLTFTEVEELERITDTGIPMLLAGLMADHYRVTHLRHVVRLALIGGGLEPERAHTLVDSYFLRSGLPRCRLLALVALSSLMGADDLDDGETITNG